MSAESSKKTSKAIVQTTLNFPISFSIKDKEKFENISTRNTNKVIQKTTQQTLLNFLPANNHIKNTKKRILDDTTINSESEDGDKTHESSSSESAEYELHDDLVNYPSNIYDEEKKLCRNKFFLRLISPKLVRCQCGKEIKLDQAYRAKNYNPTNIELPDNGNEPEELIFRGDDTIDVYQILSIRRSHEAYSNSDHVRGINQKPGVNLEINSNDQINRNAANHLITQLNSNDFGNQIIRNRNKRWQGRKRIEISLV
jgi:hypothetical protein